MDKKNNGNNGDVKIEFRRAHVVQGVQFGGREA
jgi:hypothetical protein